MELQLRRPQRKENIQRYRILYVDDEPVNLRIFQHAFKRDYIVHIALNGFDALDLLKTQKIDLVITDQQMPRMSGVDLLAKIVPKHPSIVRMIMTGFSDIGAIIRAVNEFGLDKYLVKPWDRNQLKVEFDKALEKKEKESKMANAPSIDTSISLLQSKQEVDTIFPNTILSYNGDGNRNGYWVGKSNSNAYAVFYHLSPHSTIAACTIHLFIAISLTELIYKETSDSITDLLNGLSNKIALKFENKNDFKKMNIAVVKQDIQSKEIKYIDANQNLYVVDEIGQLREQSSSSKALSLNKSNMIFEEKILPANTKKVFFLSQTLQESEYRLETQGANGKNFIKFLNKNINKLNLNELVNEKIKKEQNTCFFGIAL